MLYLLMRPIYNRYLIKPSITDNPLKLIGWNGEPLIIDAKFNPYEHAPQFGEILETPITDDGKFTIYPIGTKVFTDYLVCLDDNKVVIDSKDFYFCETQFVWATVEGDTIIPTKDYILAQKVMDDTLEENGVIIKLYAEEVKHKHIVLSNCNDYKAGEVVYMMGGVPMPIPDSDLVLIRKSTILAKELDGKLYAMNNKHLILEDETPDYNFWKGLVVTPKQIHSFKTGEYIDGSKKDLIGKKVTFLHSMFTKFIVDEKEYACINGANLIFG